MPVVTLRPRLTLIPAVPRDLPGTPTTWPIPDPSSLTDIAADLVSAIQSVGVAFARRYADVGGMLAALGDRTRTMAKVDADLRPLVLAAAGRYDDARSAVQSFLGQGGQGLRDRPYRRFARQLIRWIDAGAPTPPPAGDDLDRLAGVRPGCLRSMVKARRDQRRPRRAAVQATRRASKSRPSKTMARAEIAAVLAAELARRDTWMAGSEADRCVEVIQLRQQPLGRLRSTIWAVRLVRSNLPETVRSARRFGSRMPEWLEPPVQASYRPPHGLRGFVDVAVDADASAWLDTVEASTPRRIGESAIAPAWLEWAEHRSSDGGTDGSCTRKLVVRIGERRIGVVPALWVADFEPVMGDAAERYDELPMVEARITSRQDPARRWVEIPLPGSLADPPPGQPPIWPQWR